MTFMAKGLMLSLLLLAGSACGLAQSCIPLEVQPFDYTLDVHGTRYAGTAVVSPVPGEPVRQRRCRVRFLLTLLPQHAIARMAYL